MGECILVLTSNISNSINFKGDQSLCHHELFTSYKDGVCGDIRIVFDSVSRGHCDHFLSFKLERSF